MASGVNKVIIIGRLGADPDVKYTPSQMAVCNLSVATSESWKDKNTGEKRESTEWHKLVLWGKTAELAAQYLKKGDMAYFEGRLATEKWQDKQGNDRYTTKIKVDRMQFIGGQQNGQGKPQSTAQAPSAPAPAPQPKAPAAAQGGAQGVDPDFDDSIPF